MLYLSIDIPSLISSDSIFLGLLRITLCILRMTDFVPKASQLYTRTLTTGGNKTSILHQLKMHSQATLKHFKVFYNIGQGNHQNNYVLTSTIQLGWQKICMSMYACMRVCVYMYVYICILVDIYNAYEINLFYIRK